MCSNFIAYPIKQSVVYEKGDKDISESAMNIGFLGYFSLFSEKYHP